MGRKADSEKSLYPAVERGLQKHFTCFKTAVNKGLRYGRIDVIGVRDVGGDLSGAIETIGIEVKRGSLPFSNACGQTLGYKVYVNRVYLVLCQCEIDGYRRGNLRRAACIVNRHSIVA